MGEVYIIGVLEGLGYRWMVVVFKVVYRFDKGDNFWKERGFVYC